MKCPTCGKTVAKSAKVCKHCDADLLAKESKLEKTEEVVEVVEEVTTTGPAVEKNDRKLKLVTIKPETTEKVKTSFTNAFKYISHAILHPSAEKIPMDLPQIACVNGIHAIIYILWLYIIQKGLLEAMNIYDASGPARISSLSTVVGGIVLACGLLALVSFIVFIKDFVRKEKIEVVGILQDATHILLVPSMLLLLATIVAAFWFSIGVFFFCVTFVSLLMNVVLLFKDNNNYFSYIIVSVTIAVMIFLIYYVLSSCVENWTIAGHRVGDMLKNIIPF